MRARQQSAATSGLPDLEAYNQQVLACQHEAFTLAAHLLGNDRAADAVVERAFRHVYRDARRSTSSTIRLPVLREVVRLCSRPPTGRRKALGPWRHLSQREQEALLLVDLLGLSYLQAADILDCSKEHLARWLAQARSKGPPSSLAPTLL